MFSMGHDIVPATDDCCNTYPNFVKNSSNNRVNNNNKTPVSITAFCDHDYAYKSDSFSKSKFARQSTSAASRVLVQDVSEDVFELDLDWTPVGLDEAPPIKSCKTSRSHDSDIEEEVHKGAAVVYTKDVSRTNVTGSSCRCAYCYAKPESRSKLDSGSSRGLKRSPGSPPPSKKALIVGSPEQDDDPITPSVLLGRPQTPSLIQCDDNFEYTTEAYEWRRGMEDRSWAGCKMALSIQTDLNAQMRKTLLVWLLAMNRQFNFSLETWCLTVSLVDRFLAIQPLNRDCLQLVGLTAFFVAAKLEEVEPPQISELIGFCAGSYSRKQFLWMELLMLSYLKFEILSPTASFFLHHQVEMEELQEAWPYDISIVLVEQALCDQWTSNFPSSVLSRVIFNVIVENWNPELYPDDIAEDEDFIEHLFSMVKDALTP